MQQMPYWKELEHVYPRLPTVKTIFTENQVKQMNSR